MSVNILAGVSTKILWNQYGFVMSVGWNRKNRPKPNSIEEIMMANNRMYLVCNVCLPEGEEYDYDKWVNVSFHVAKWYPGEIGEWYTNRASHDLIQGQGMATALDKFFLDHAHPDKYPGGVENPVRLEYEWQGTPTQSQSTKQER